LTPDAAFAAPEAITPRDLSAALGDGSSVATRTAVPFVLDVRELWEVEICQISGSVHVPMGEVPNRLDALPKDRPIVVMCHHGMRSLRVTQWLRTQDWPNVSNLTGGIDAWAAQVDHGMARY
jgi:rhodanese-related sulfurtransferase